MSNKFDSTPVDNPKENDNRSYDYTGCADQFRAEYPVIAEWFETGAKIVDYGCGNGALFQYLAERKNISGVGLDCSESGVHICRQKGIDAKLQRIDVPVPRFRDGEFDYAICNVTMQMCNYPEVLFREMIRVSKFQIVSFPNFAFISNRLEMLFRGRMPQKMLFGYTWYATGHIHQLSIADFNTFLRGFGGIHILRTEYLPRHVRMYNLLCRLMPNLFAKTGIFMTRK
jgi:methionine biosynthesis protein MetW